MKTLTRNEPARFLAEHDHYLLLTHQRPDGDTLGSAAALCRGLRSLGKTAHILDNPQITPKYQPYVDGLTIAQCPENAVIVAVDMADTGLFPLSGQELTEQVSLCIDHHGSNSGYAAHTLVDPDCAACGELIFSLLQLLQVPLDRAMAEALYVALSTDTGCFRYSNVTASTLRIAAQLKDCGAELYPINKALFETRRFARLKLEARLTETIRFACGGKIGICSIPWKLRGELGLNEDDLDDIAGFARDIEGVEIGVMLKEQETGGCKLSVRSSPRYDACAICSVLGGGGHRAAAGATVQRSLTESQDAVLQAILQVYPNL